jgi:SRSO17 transposase
MGNAPGFLDELRTFHDIFADCFARKELREHFFRYMVGRFRRLERQVDPFPKSGKIRAMQRFVSEAAWDDERILEKYRSFVRDDLGDEEGVLIFDEFGFDKKGRESAGVGKQGCGRSGKAENRQVGVFAAYVSPKGYALVDKRLYVPPDWFGDECRDRRVKSGFPKEARFRSKAELAAEMLRTLSAEGRLPFRYVHSDSAFGAQPAFVEAAESAVGAGYFISAPPETPCYPILSVTAVKGGCRGDAERGSIRKRAVEPVPIAALAHETPDFFWYRRKIEEGARGRTEYEFSQRRVALPWISGPPKTVLLILRRTLGRNPVYSYFLSTAPDETGLDTFVFLSGLRWVMEQILEETKNELGMARYEVRKFRGWHHHILACMLGHFFLWHRQIRMGKKSRVYYFVLRL